MPDGTEDKPAPPPAEPTATAEEEVEEVEEYEEDFDDEEATNGKNENASEVKEPASTQANSEGGSTDAQKSDAKTTAGTSATQPADKASGQEIEKPAQPEVKAVDTPAAHTDAAPNSARSTTEVPAAASSPKQVEADETGSEPDPLDITFIVHGPAKTEEHTFQDDVEWEQFKAKFGSFGERFTYQTHTSGGGIKTVTLEDKASFDDLIDYMMDDSEGDNRHDGRLDLYPVIDQQQGGATANRGAAGVSTVESKRPAALPSSTEIHEDGSQSLSLRMQTGQQQASSLASIADTVRSTFSGASDAGLKLLPHLSALRNAFKAKDTSGTGRLSIADVETVLEETLKTAGADENLAKNLIATADGEGEDYVNYGLMLASIQLLPDGASAVHSDVLGNAELQKARAHLLRENPALWSALSAPDLQASPVSPAQFQTSTENILGVDCVPLCQNCPVNASGQQDMRLLLSTLSAFDVPTDVERGAVSRAVAAIAANASTLSATGTGGPLSASEWHEKVKTTLGQTNVSLDQALAAASFVGAVDFSEDQKQLMVFPSRISKQACVAFDHDTLRLQLAVQSQPVFCRLAERRSAVVEALTPAADKKGKVKHQSMSEDLWTAAVKALEPQSEQDSASLKAALQSSQASKTDALIEWIQGIAPVDLLGEMKNADLSWVINKFEVLKSCQQQDSSSSGRLPVQEVEVILQQLLSDNGDSDSAARIAANLALGTGCVDYVTALCRRFLLVPAKTALNLKCFTDAKLREGRMRCLAAMPQVLQGLRKEGKERIPTKVLKSVLKKETQLKDEAVLTSFIDSVGGKDVSLRSLANLQATSSLALAGRNPTNLLFAYRSAVVSLGHSGQGVENAINALASIGSSDAWGVGPSLIACTLFSCALPGNSSLTPGQDICRAAQRVACLLPAEAQTFRAFATESSRLCVLDLCATLYLHGMQAAKDKDSAKSKKKVKDTIIKGIADGFKSILDLAPAAFPSGALSVAEWISSIPVESKKSKGHSLIETLTAWKPEVVPLYPAPVNAGGRFPSIAPQSSGTMSVSTPSKDSATPAAAKPSTNKLKGLIGKKIAEGKIVTPSKDGSSATAADVISQLTGLGSFAESRLGVESGENSTSASLRPRWSADGMALHKVQPKEGDKQVQISVGLKDTKALPAPAEGKFRVLSRYAIVCLWSAQKGLFGGKVKFNVKADKGGDHRWRFSKKESALVCFAAADQDDCFLHVELCSVVTRASDKEAAPSSEGEEGGSTKASINPQRTISVFAQLPLKDLVNASKTAVLAVQGGTPEQPRELVTQETGGVKKSGLFKQSTKETTSQVIVSVEHPKANLAGVPLRCTMQASCGAVVAGYSAALERAADSLQTAGKPLRDIIMPSKLAGMDKIIDNPSLLVMTRDRLSELSKLHSGGVGDVNTQAGQPRLEAAAAPAIALLNMSASIPSGVPLEDVANNSTVLDLLLGQSVPSAGHGKGGVQGLFKPVQIEESLIQM